ncbi:hypothetical protein H5410_061926 [Solanum commersonii]|uniref:Uncharacterized protein n=1 Tax=Solanum commersonii TaxID=4109 RepID=A0A9J5WAP6_SOLCO|nr:hypothetical protein H5410_061926 [Solanum commersonii]
MYQAYNEYNVGDAGFANEFAVNKAPMELGIAEVIHLLPKILDESRVKFSTRVARDQPTPLASLGRESGLKPRWSMERLERHWCEKDRSREDYRSGIVLEGPKVISKEGANNKVDDEVIPNVPIRDEIDEELLKKDKVDIGEEKEVDPPRVIIDESGAERGGRCKVRNSICLVRLNRHAPYKAHRIPHLPPNFF